MGKAPQKTPFLKTRYQTMNTRFRLKFQRILHFVKGRRNALRLHPLVDKQEQLMLFSSQHFHPQIEIHMTIGGDAMQRTKRKLSNCSSLVLFSRQLGNYARKTPDGIFRTSTRDPASSAGACGARTTSPSASVKVAIIELSCLEKVRTRFSPLSLASKVARR